MSIEFISDIIQYLLNNFEVILLINHTLKKVRLFVQI